MNYRITTDFVPPFRVFPMVEQRTSDQVEVMPFVSGQTSCLNEDYR